MNGGCSTVDNLICCYENSDKFHNLHFLGDFRHLSDHMRIAVSFNINNDTDNSHVPKKKKIRLDKMQKFRNHSNFIPPEPDSGMIANLSGPEGLLAFGNAEQDCSRATRRQNGESVVVLVKTPDELQIFHQKKLYRLFFDLWRSPPTDAPYMLLGCKQHIFTYI